VNKLVTCLCAVSGLPEHEELDPTGLNWGKKHTGEKETEKETSGEKRVKYCNSWQEL